MIYTLINLNLIYYDTIKMQTRAEIIVKGEVQGVGYRDSVFRIARKLNINGFVENIKPYDVKIVSEGDKENITKFIGAINIKKFPVDVEGVDVKYTEPTGEFEYFEIKRGNWKEELGERMDVAGRFLYRSVELGEKSVALGEKSVALGEKSVALGEKSVALGEKSVALGEKSVGLQETMIEKQDETIRILKDVKHDTSQMLEKQDMVIEKQDETTNALKDIKQDTLYIPCVLGEIQDLKVKQDQLESEAIEIKRVLIPA